MGSNPIVSTMLDSHFLPQISLYRNLLTIKGISKSRAKQICNSLGVSTLLPLSQLPSHKSSILTNLLADLERSPSIGRNLDLFIKDRIETLILINTHRGRRIRYGYPAHGQRTSSNAKTCRHSRKFFLL